MTLRKKLPIVAATLSLSCSLGLFSAIPQTVLAGPEDRRAMFGETHLHTNLSFDAFVFGNRNGPDAAYDFA